jgi:hypothetical protein
MSWRSASDEKEDAMNDESTTANTENKREGARTWEGGFGRRRFRAQWDRGPGRAWFHFQGPFTENNDPDGLGTALAPDFGFEWKQGEGARTYGEYEEYLEELRKKTERAARRTAERARHYAQRATRRVRDTKWNAVENEVLAAVEKALADLEDALARIRREWSKGQEGSRSSAGISGTRAQRVRIEYEKVADPLEEDPSPGLTGSASSTPLSRDERDAQRRTLLEELRAGAISIEEAEQRLNKLGS